MKIRMNAQEQNNEYSNSKQRERKEHKNFRELRKNRNNRWQSAD